MSTTNQRRRRRSAIALIAIFLLTLVAVAPVCRGLDGGRRRRSARTGTTRPSSTSPTTGRACRGSSGYLGQDITTATGVDPQTLLTDSTVANDVDVIANIPPDVNISNGGVGEFEVDDPVVALQPDGIADAPYLLLNLRTTGFRNIAVSYLLRDIDSSIDNAVQPVALQYRVGSSGILTNVPAGFVADATTGPLLATLVTPKNVALPARPRTTGRWCRSGSSPRTPSRSDEWVGVDNIQVAATPLDQPPAVQSTSPVGGTADVARDANLSVTFSEPVDVSSGWFAISCGTSQGHTAAVSGGPLTFTLDPDTDFAFGESCNLYVYAQNVADQDTDDPPNLMLADYLATFQTVAAPPDQAPGVQSTSPATAPPTSRATRLSRDLQRARRRCRWRVQHRVHEDLRPRGRRHGWSADIRAPSGNDFAYDETCTLTVYAQNVTDQDTDDPPNLMAADYVATFQTVAAPPVIDDAPAVQSTSPGNGATDVARGANLSVTFDEPVDVTGDWFDITCATSHGHTAAVSGGPLTFSLDPGADFAYDEACTFTVSAGNVSDQDTNDPPNLMTADHVATFHTVAAPPDPPKPPTVDAGGPYDVVVGGSVNVSATGSQPDGQTLTYRWDLDDNGSFETPGQSVTFSAAGLAAP